MAFSGRGGYGSWRGGRRLRAPTAFRAGELPHWRPPDNRSPPPNETRLPNLKRELESSDTPTPLNGPSDAIETSQKNLESFDPTPDQKRAKLERAVEQQPTTSSAGDNAGAGGSQVGSGGVECAEESVGDSGTDTAAVQKHFRDQTLLEPVSDEAVRAVNCEMVLMNRGSHAFFCCLCSAKLSQVQLFVKHMTGMEHERKSKMFVNWRRNKERFPFFCKVCVSSCTNEAMFQDHLQGKKHAKAVTMRHALQREEYVPVPLQLVTRLLDGPAVKKVGTALSLGLSSTMMAFFTLPGPFIGLCYAEEIGSEGDLNPRYFCHVCKTNMDYNNAELHFTSTTHRQNVLGKDYPQLLAENPRTDAKKDTERCARLAAEIEAREGRKVEQMRRKILQEDWKELAISTLMSDISTASSKGRYSRGQGSRSSTTTPTAGGTFSWERGAPGPSRSIRGAAGQRGRGFPNQGAFGQRGRGVQSRAEFGQGGANWAESSGVGRGQRGRGVRRGSDGGQVTIVRGRGGFGRGERGGVWQGRRSRGIAGRGRGTRGRGGQWGDVLSQAYGGLTSHGGPVSEGQWNRSSVQISNSLEDDGFVASGGGFHDYHDSFHGYHESESTNDGYWAGEGVSWNQDQPEPEYESQTGAGLWRGHQLIGVQEREHRGRQRGRGRGGSVPDIHQSYHFEANHVTSANSWQSEALPHQWEGREGEGWEWQQPKTASSSSYVSQPPPPHPPPPLVAQDRVGYPAPPPQTEPQNPATKADILRNLALSSIDTEEDAELALQLSSSLTQALLAYRIKNVPTASPLNELLKAVKDVPLPPKSPQ